MEHIKLINVLYIEVALTTRVAIYHFVTTEQKHYHISVNCLSALFIPYLLVVCRDMLDSIAVNMAQEPESRLVSIQLHGSMSEYQLLIVATEDVMTTDFSCVLIT
ncbi:hypothetical protein NP493_560g01059 [Ridgeia piscesae]|uniref:Uncharacterized protein n=1 Tax=Ridgeia piscesae TaxID=27915 RepID=A0AAD9KWF4_RIDPI|nr:hypothetical protein NP493_560g01059 [Ridgeia piscesae]